MNLVILNLSCKKKQYEFGYPNICTIYGTEIWKKIRKVQTAALKTNFYNSLQETNTSKTNKLPVCRGERENTKNLLCYKLTLTKMDFCQNVSVMYF